MDPFGFLLGAATFTVGVKLKKPLRKAAVFAACQFMAAADRMKTTAYGMKEEIEDIVAEAQYENMKRNMSAHGNPVSTDNVTGLYNLNNMDNMNGMDNMDSTGRSPEDAG